MIMTRNGKPGAERNRWRPDSILVWTAAEESTLMQCLEAKLTDHKRTSIKALMKYNQVALNSMPTSQFDQPVHAGDTLSVNFTRPFVVFSHPRIKLVYEDNDIIVINKGSGIRAICNHLGCSLADTIGFGDSDNDLQMTDVVGISVCMANGSDNLKKRCDRICPAVTDDGIAREFAALGLI